MFNLNSTPSSDSIRDNLIATLLSADAKISFSLVAGPGESGWQKWVDAMRAISRLPGGIPSQLRRKLWVGLADNYLASNRIDWGTVSKSAFNEKSNPDDSALGLQIVKDLHRTGCSNTFLPANADVEVEKTLLKRVLLAYARWNKQTGYCQGFNVLATVILDTVDRNENDALKVLIYLIDHVLPTGYFSNCLRLLAVDLAVFRHLLAANLPQLAAHLDKLQKKATQAGTMEYEPPLTNVFLMQWLLTIYATCLPKQQLLRFWDCLLLNGSDYLLSPALYIFTKLSKQIMACQTVDQFYTRMEQLVPNLREKTTNSATEADAFIQAIYKQLKPSVGELREQLLYSIQPFMTTPSLNGALDSNNSNNKDGSKSSAYVKTLFGNVASTICGRSLQHNNSSSSHLNNLNNGQNQSAVGISSSSYAGGGGGGFTEEQLAEIGAVRERMTTDLRKLKRNYDRLTKHRNSAIVVIPSAIDDATARPINGAIVAAADHHNNNGNDSGNRIMKPPKSSGVIRQHHHHHPMMTLSSAHQQLQPCFKTTQSTFDVINHLLVSKVGLDEVNQKILSAPILEMMLPPSMLSLSSPAAVVVPNSPMSSSSSSSPYTSRRFDYSSPPSMMMNNHRSSSQQSLDYVADDVRTPLSCSGIGSSSFQTPLSNNKSQTDYHYYYHHQHHQHYHEPSSPSQLAEGGGGGGGGDSVYSSSSSANQSSDFSDFSGHRRRPVLSSLPVAEECEEGKADDAEEGDVGVKDCRRNAHDPAATITTAINNNNNNNNVMTVLGEDHQVDSLVDIDISSDCETTFHKNNNNNNNNNSSSSYSSYGNYGSNSFNSSNYNYNYNNSSRYYDDDDYDDDDENNNVNNNTTAVAIETWSPESAISHGKASARNSKSRAPATTKYQAFFDKFAMIGSQSPQSPSAAAPHSMSSSIFEPAGTPPSLSSPSHHHQQQQSPRSPFPISTAARLKQRLHLIPGLGLPAAARERATTVLQ